MQSILRFATLLVLFPLVGCGRQESGNAKVYPATLTPYQVVIADLAATSGRWGNFPGRKVLVLAEVCQTLAEDDYVHFPFPVSAELRASLFRENADSRELNLSELSGHHSEIDTDESHSVQPDLELETHGDTCCMVQFWHAGYSRDGKTAIIYFKYSNKWESGFGTYVIRKTVAGWNIRNADAMFYASR